MTLEQATDLVGPRVREKNRAAIVSREPGKPCRPPPPNQGLMLGRFTRTNLLLVLPARWEYSLPSIDGTPFPGMGVLC